MAHGNKGIIFPILILNDYPAQHGNLLINKFGGCFFKNNKLLLNLDSLTVSRND